MNRVLPKEILLILSIHEASVVSALLYSQLVATPSVIIFARCH